MTEGERERFREGWDAGFRTGYQEGRVRAERNVFLAIAQIQCAVPADDQIAEVAPVRELMETIIQWHLDGRPVLRMPDLETREGDAPDIERLWREWEEGQEEDHDDAG